MKEIKQTRKAKEEFKSELLPLLFSDENVTYDELKLKLGKNRREISRMLSDVSMYYALLSISYEKGHRIAKPIDSLNSIEELEDELQKVDAMISQTRSRFTTIRKKLKPLIAWKKVAQSKIEELSNK